MLGRVIVVCGAGCACACLCVCLCVKVCGHRCVCLCVCERDRECPVCVWGVWCVCVCACVLTLFVCVLECSVDNTAHGDVNTRKQAHIFTPTHTHAHTHAHPPHLGTEAEVDAAGLASVSDHQVEYVAAALVTCALVRAAAHQRVHAAPRLLARGEQQRRPSLGVLRVQLGALQRALASGSRGILQRGRLLLLGRPRASPLITLYPALNLSVYAGECALSWIHPFVGRLIHFRHLVQPPTCSSHTHPKTRVFHQVRHNGSDTSTCPTRPTYAWCNMKQCSRQLQCEVPCQ